MTLEEALNASKHRRARMIIETLTGVTWECTVELGDDNLYEVEIGEPEVTSTLAGHHLGLRAAGILARSQGFIGSWESA